MPPRNLLTRKFYKLVVGGKKRVLTKKEASKVDIKLYAELSTEFALKSAAEDQLSRLYVPEEWFLPKAKVDRKYLWRVLATARPDFVDQLILNAYKMRDTEGDIDKNQTPINVC